MLVNLTQHVLTDEQRSEGVRDIPDHVEIRRLLTFENIPDRNDIKKRAVLLAEKAREAGAEGALIGGTPYLMSSLERELQERGIRPLYSYSLRESREIHKPDGSVEKVMVFRHSGFIDLSAK